jgi:hypothetical protein
LARVSAPLRDGAPWNTPGAQPFSSSGVSIRVPSSQATALRLALDGNDSYILEFRRDAQVLGSAVIPSATRAGMYARRVSVPEEARATGYNTLFVRPERGDTAYSVGDIRWLD